ncbi:MAG: cytochrome c-type biogenesis protein CcmH [Marinobacter excellens HL-55]|uniref:Cytochrome c-type biogenesis protein n=1 Tax=Marinobacter excellens HL-55 TaxID=1305731 RepID=A0A0P8D1S6_9GAMM|nr:MAG: cytochrome c-type biogenesis protein CcmH [Marinobacter excellens HL-55]
MRFMPIFLAAMWVFAATAHAQGEAPEFYDFDTQAEEQRFRGLIAELRCPKCQNQNIADSNAPISKDMRDQVYLLMQSGATDDEIVGALVDRFGEFVKYKPPVDRRTILLWGFPAIAVFGGFMIVAGVVIRSRKQSPEPALSAEEQARVRQMLADRDPSSRS